MEHNLMTVKEVGDVLRLTDTSVYALIYKKDLLPIVVGGRYRISETELDRYLRENQVRREALSA